MRGLAAAGACSALLLTACSGDPEPPQTLPPLSGAPSQVSTAPVTSAPQTADGATAFVRQWFATLNQAFAARESRALLALSTPECETCRNYADVIDSLAARSESVDGGLVELVYAEAPPVVRGAVVVDAAFTRTASRRFDAQGKLLTSAPAAPKTIVQIKLVWRGTSWRFDAMRLAGSPG